MKKIILIISGFLCLVVGGIGIIVPVLPTTPFVLLGSFCFSGSSTRINAWLSKTKYFGAYINNYKHKTGLDKKIKIQSIIFLWLVLIVSAVVFRKVYVWIILGVVGIAVTIHICLIKAKKKEEIPADSTDEKLS